MSAATRAIERWQWLLLLLLPFVWGSLLVSSDYSVDPDTYIHLGIARRMLETGWLGTFPWLPHSTIADPFVDQNVVQHLLLVPVVALFGARAAVPVGTLLLACSFAASLYFILRRRGVRWPAPWIVLGLLACPLTLLYSLAIKGIATFLIVLVWFLDGLWAGATRRLFLLAWFACYVYVGAIVLLPFAFAHLLVARVWTARWELRVVGATVVGWLTGMVVNPFWPAHWNYIARELRSFFIGDGALLPGEFRGTEWAPMTGPALAQVAGAMMVTWAMVLMHRLARGQRPSLAAASASLMSFGLFGAALVSGSKMLELFLVVSILALPLLMIGAPRTHRATLIAIGVAALSASIWSVNTIVRDLKTVDLVRTQDYEDMAHWIGKRGASTSMVVAPWDDMPGLFLFGGDQRYMAGYNVRFLQDHDAVRFNAYALLYQGAINDPQVAMQTLFDDSRFLLVRSAARSVGDVALTRNLAANPAFVEHTSPSRAWRVFEVVDTKQGVAQ